MLCVAVALKCLKKVSDLKDTEADVIDQEYHYKRNSIRFVQESIKSNGYKISEEFNSGGSDEPINKSVWFSVKSF